MKFYNREKELDVLEETYKQKGANFVVITGRRRIGKTELIQEFVKKNNKEYLYFFVTKKRSTNLLREFNNQFNQKRKSEAIFLDWDSFIKELLEFCLQNEVILIFDEFQEFLKIDDSVFSIFQKHWDKYQNINKGKLNLIVSGSYISMMEKIFYSTKEPLYGRTTKKIKLREFNFKTVQNILKDHLTKGEKEVSITKLLSFYTVFGGIPYYYYLIEKEEIFKNNLDSIIENLILKSDGILHNEGKEVLTKEFGSEYSSYFAVLESISLGYNTFSLIQKYTGLNNGFLLRLLQTLSSHYQIIKKEKPLFPNNKKVNRYKILNNFISFWFKYIFFNQSILELDETTAISNKIQNEIKSQMGTEYEKFCIEYILDIENNHSDDLNNETYKIFKQENILEIGKWWDKNGEIDIVLRTETDRIILIECKLTAQQITEKSVEKLIETASRIDAIKNKKKNLLLMVAERCPKEIKSRLSQKGIYVIETI